MNQSNPINKQIVKEAADWFSLNEQRELTGSERQQFMSWLQQSPMHVKEYLFLESFSEFLQDIDVEPSNELSDSNVVYHSDHSFVTGPTLSNASVNSDIQLTELKSASHGRAGWFGKYTSKVIWSLAASLMLSVGVVSYLSFSTVSNVAPVNPTVVYKSVAVPVGQTRKLRLSDGSELVLNTDTRLNYLIDDTRRRVQILEGEVYFDIAHDTRRPFLISANNSLIKVLGTAFNVRVAKEKTVISVTEGVVLAKALEGAGKSKQTWLAAELPQSISESASLKLPVGTEAVVEKQDGKVAMRSLDVTQIASWLHDELIFKNAALQDVINEYNRYNKVKISLIGNALKQQLITGIFNPRDYDSIVAYISQSYDVEVMRQDNYIFIQQRPFNPY